MAMGVDGAAPGDTVELELDGVGRLAGEVDFSNEHFLGLRTADTLYRFFGRNSFCAPVGHDRPRLQRPRGLRRHGQGLGRLPREGLRLGIGGVLALREIPGDPQMAWRH
jgi:hypothetical protein